MPPALGEMHDSGTLTLTFSAYREHMLLFHRYTYLHKSSHPLLRVKRLYNAFCLEHTDYGYQNVVCLILSSIVKRSSRNHQCQSCQLYVPPFAPLAQLLLVAGKTSSLSPDPGRNSHHHRACLNCGGTHFSMRALILSSVLMLHTSVCSVVRF